MTHSPQPMTHKPTIIINVKAYEQGIGDNLTLLARQLSAVQGIGKAQVMLAVQPADIFRLQGLPIQACAQHMEGIYFGSHTGHLHARSIEQAGARCTLLNHAECQLDNDKIASAIIAAHREGMQVCVCANTPERGAEIAHLAPDFIAVEPPDLIGGDKSVSKARPEVIQQAVALIQKVRPQQAVLVGAGIKTSEDLQIALRLGAQGVLLASGIVLHPNPTKALGELLSRL
jgi:triosephosphate isomerase (TIM)